MKLDKGCSLFFGTKIDSKLREGLALSKPGDKKYFDGSSDEFLRVIEIGDDKDKERWPRAIALEMQAAVPGGNPGTLRRIVTLPIRAEEPKP